jgi:branched-chain amino acid transport system ATP-binding protein
MTQPRLAVHELHVRHGGVEAVRGVSLRVMPGEVVALLGVNGAGKTSLMDAVAGLNPIASGRIELDGEPVHGLRPEDIVRRGIALSPEGRRVFAALSVDENLRLGGIPVRDRAAREETRERVLELFPRLRERLQQPSGTLSGGEQQMLAIGRALMARPRVLLLDEPSLGLAPIVVTQIFDLVRRLKEEGMTMLIVEQNALGALELADRAYVLVHGAVEEEAAAADLLARSDLAETYLGGGAA